MDDFSIKVDGIIKDLNELLNSWTPLLVAMSDDLILKFRNEQGRNIKQILGHMIDSVSNNTHRVIHLQYRESPVNFPDYANLGINDVWIRIQKYEEENWENLVQLWRFSHLHFLHVIDKIDIDKLNNFWISATGEEISLAEMVIDFPLHFRLHISEIQQLIAKSK